MEENKQEEVKNAAPEVQETDVENQQTEPELVVDERPEINYKAEIARKNAEIERLRLEAASRASEPAKRDPNDIRTWPDHELRMLKKDAQFAQYHDQADDILMERKVQAMDQKRRETENRMKADLELKSRYPESADPGSTLSMKMEEVMLKYDLSKSPAGRLAAAELAANELKRGQSTTKSVAQKKESDRVAALKANMVDGDRAKPTNEGANLDQKRKDLSEKLLSGNAQNQVDALEDILKDRFGGSDKFFNRKK